METHNSPDIEITGDTDEANRANSTQGNNDDYASQGPQSVTYLRVQELQNTGYASSNSATPEASPCVSANTQMMNRTRSLILLCVKSILSNDKAAENHKAMHQRTVLVKAC
ncbi:hypothetical protein OS493_026278 [Desmophyllum pertusum]|uniref:Uncharacterized protein n=1 Tax=Desmophyllum pertusum TaxID=174260 RepID=A0A9W9ZLD2_9CNID|nr:hypothetical protein OS493_026278 [Desmophyllum pertusum]